MATLSRLPVGPGVEYHSIIGKQEDGTRLESSSDGVVPYASAHLDGATLELVVRGDHGCQDSPETIREIRRLLGVHLAERDAAASERRDLFRADTAADDDKDRERADR